MTNASMYVYNDLEDYMLLYPKGQDIITESHLDSLFINKKSVVFVSNNSKGVLGFKADFSKSFVFFDQGEEAFDRYEKDFEPVVEVKVKNRNITFYGQEIEHTFYVARKYGTVKDGHVKGYILYDDTKPRANFIMTPIKPLS